MPADRCERVPIGSRGLGPKDAEDDSNLLAPGSVIMPKATERAKARARTGVRVCSDCGNNYSGKRCICQYITDTEGHYKSVGWQECKESVVERLFGEPLQTDIEALERMIKRLTERIERLIGRVEVLEEWHERERELWREGEN